MASFVVHLPVETIVAIQREGGLEQVLQDLSLTASGPYRIVHDVTRKVVDDVRAFPYALTAKTEDMPHPTLTSAVLLGHIANSPKAKGYASPSSTTSTTVHTPLSSNVTASASKPADNIETSYEHAVNVTVCNGVTGEAEVFHVSKSTTIPELAALYAECMGTATTEHSFEYSDGGELPTYCYAADHDVPNSLSSLGIEYDIVINATATAAQPAAPITVTIRDLMLQEQDFTISGDATFEYLFHLYADRVHSSASDLTFTNIPGYGTYDFEHIHYPQALNEHDIHDGSLILVKPKVDEGYSIEFIVRNAMNKEEPMTLQNTATISELDKLYCDFTGFKYGTLLFELDGMTFGDCADYTIHPTTRIEDIAIYDGAILATRPNPEMGNLESGIFPTERAPRCAYPTNDQATGIMGCETAEAGGCGSSSPATNW